jgi:hypothetical protein
MVADSNREGVGRKGQTGGRAVSDRGTTKSVMSVAEAKDQ